nr:aspartate dehydrogenase [uncultured Oscillibacter sp.]
MLFGKRKKEPAVQYDKAGKVPVIRSSICTGEQVAGFKDLATGKFQELMLIRDQRDLQDFLRRYQVEEPEIRREW